MNTLAHRWEKVRLMWTRPMTTEEQRQWRVRCEDAMNCMCVVARLFKCLPQSGLAAVWEINPEVPWNLVKLGENNLSTVPWRPCWDGVATMDTSTTSSIWGWDGKLNPLLFSIGIATYNLGSPLASSQLYIGEQWSVDERNVATYKCGGLNSWRMSIEGKLSVEWEDKKVRFEFGIRVELWVDVWSRACVSRQVGWPS